MQIWHAALLGIIEGLTEFLPVSSTFHLIFASQLLGLEQTEFVKLFEVAIQTGGILAVLSLFGKELFTNRKLIPLLLASFLPTVVIGFALHDVIKSVFFDNNALMLFAFIAVGIGFIALERWISQRKLGLSANISTLSWRQAALVGAAQGLAVLPGVSRAGSVIVAMMLLRIKRDEAAKYSFLLALPTIASAGFLDLLKFESQGSIALFEWQLLGIGCLTAWLSALVVLRWFVRYVQHHTLTSFGWYRIVAGALLLGMV